MVMDGESVFTMKLFFSPVSYAIKAPPIQQRFGGYIEGMYQRGVEMSLQAKQTHPRSNLMESISDSEVSGRIVGKEKTVQLGLIVSEMR